MKRKGLCWFRLLLSLALFAAFGAPPGGLGVVVQHIQIVGARQWLNLVAGAPPSGAGIPARPWSRL